MAASIAARHNLPHYDLDYYFWRAGWREPPPDEWQTTAERLASGPAWVISGNYSKTFHDRMSRADTVIWLDFPRWLCMTRVLRRIARNYGRVRSGMPEGCTERIDWKFLRYAWTFNKIRRPRIVAALESHAARAQVYQVRNKAEAARLLASLGGEG